MQIHFSASSESVAVTIGPPPSNLDTKDFPSSWTLDLEGPKDDDGSPLFIIDKSTKERYFNDSSSTIRCKCALLALGTPLVHPVTSVLNIAYRIGRLVTCQHFTGSSQDEDLKEAGKDLLRAAISPVSVVGLELAALYGICRPHDGRKLYARIEKAVYNGPVMAPCFQPDPQYHLLGGDTNKRNSF